MILPDVEVASKIVLFPSFVFNKVSKDIGRVLRQMFLFEAAPIMVPDWGTLDVGFLRIIFIGVRYRMFAHVWENCCDDDRGAVLFNFDKLSPLS